MVLTNIWCGAAYADNGADGADGAVPPAKTGAIGSGGLTADYTESANDGTAGGDYKSPYPDIPIRQSKAAAKAVMAAV